MEQPDHQQAGVLVSIRLSYSTVSQRALAETEASNEEQVRSHLSNIVSNGEGRIVAESANELIAAFDDPQKGLMITRVMQQVVAQELAKQGVTIRIGLVQPLRGFSEETWPLAIAKSRELARLATSSQTLACVPSPSDFDVPLRSNLTEVEPEDWHDELCNGRGKVHCVLWQDDVPTRIVLASGEMNPVTRIRKLRLRWRDEQFVLTDGSQQVTFGRGANSDITIDSGFASRDHAHVEYMHSCFVLCDHSTNGTYVQIDGSEVFVHDDEVILRGEGWISLGRRPPSNKGMVVYFWAESDTPAT